MFVHVCISSCQSRAPRLRYRVTGARGGRVLHTPSGTVPPEMMKLAIVKQQRMDAAGTGGGDEDQEDYEEEY